MRDALKLKKSVNDLVPRIRKSAYIPKKSWLPPSVPESNFIKRRDFPSPNGGIIRLLLLDSPQNRNAISRDLLNELTYEIYLANVMTANKKRTRQYRAQSNSLDAEAAEPDDVTSNSSVLHHGESTRPPLDQVTNGGFDSLPSIRALVFGSQVDGSFCAGADLKERRTMSIAEYVLTLYFDLLGFQEDAVDRLSPETENIH